MIENKQKSERPRVYALYSTVPFLKPYGGDHISELETLRWMSLACDVYYNGVLFDPGSNSAGVEGAEIYPPDGSYDLAYVRDNVAILRQARELGLRTLFLGRVSQEDVFAFSDAIAVHTPQEAVLIDELYPGFPTFLAEQPGRDGFIPRQNSRKTGDYRKRWGGGFTLGFLGRIDEASFPNTFYSAKDVLSHYISDMNVIFAGKVKWKYNLPTDVIYETEYFAPGLMPYALSACDATIGIEQPEAEHAGSNRTIECIRCGVPIVTRPYAARREQLGDDYPLFFTTVSELVEKMVSLRFDPVFKAAVSQYIEEIRPRFSYREIQNRNSDRLIEWLSVEKKA